MEYKLDEEDIERIKVASKRLSETPLMKFGSVDVHQHAQDELNKVWKSVGDKHGFNWETAKPSSSVMQDGIISAEAK